MSNHRRPNKISFCAYLPAPLVLAMRELAWRRRSTQTALVIEAVTRLIAEEAPDLLAGSDEEGAA